MNQTLSAFKGDIYSVQGYSNSLSMVLAELEKYDKYNLLISSKLIGFIEEIDLKYTREELASLVKNCVIHADILKQNLLKFQKYMGIKNR